MTQSIYDLTVDFVNHHGHFMVLTSPRGLKQEELSDFQLNMLAANRIPHLLELQLEAREGDIRLFYPITGKRMLAHSLRMEKLTMHRFFSLLHSIVEVLCDSKVYMLQPSRYILQEEFIYCGEGMEDLYLTYVPKEHLEGKQSIASELQQLASRWVHRITELHGSGYQELMNYLLEDSFTLPELKQLLLKHMLQTAAVSAKTAAPFQRETMEAVNVWQGPAAAAEAPELRPEAHRAPVKRSAAADLLRMEAGFSPEASADAIAAEPFPKPAVGVPREGSRRRLLIILMAVLALCFIWKLYAESQGRRMLYGCAGASAIVCSAAVVLLRKNRADQQVEQPVEQEYIVPDEGDSRFFSEIGLGATVPEEIPLPRAEPRPVMHTTVLQRADATVFLGRSAVPEAAAAPVPYLECWKNGICEKILLGKSSFVIGRAGEGADWVQDEAGVSRLHAEIVKEGTSYGIKDLGSRNGTVLNGVLLAPYRVHPLSEGDIVKIVTTEFTFKMGS